jgi:hypothetical protein
MATPDLQGVPVVVVASGGIPVVNGTIGTPMTVGDNDIGTAVTIVSAFGLPVVLLNQDGTAYVP